MRFVEELHKRGVRFVHAGSRERISKKALKLLDQGEALTKNNGPETFNLAFNYSGRAEITHVARNLVAAHVPAETITEQTINQNLWTAGLPDVDLLVRTGFEHRISNFMLWQCAHASVYFADAFWPDLSETHIELALQSRCLNSLTRPLPTNSLTT